MKQKTIHPFIYSSIHPNIHPWLSSQFTSHACFWTVMCKVENPNREVGLYALRSNIEIRLSPLSSALHSLFDPRSRATNWHLLPYSSAPICAAWPCVRHAAAKHLVGMAVWGCRWQANYLLHSLLLFVSIVKATGENMFAGHSRGRAGSWEVEEENTDRTPTSHFVIHLKATLANACMFDYVGKKKLNIKNLWVHTWYNSIIS